MFKNIFSILLIVALASTAIGMVSSAKASAYTANWVVAVTYQNVGTASTYVTVYFYPEDSSTPIPFDPLDGGQLNQGAGRSFFIGNVNGIGDDFTGNAVMSSSEPLVATVVQFSNDPGFKMRLLSNGFQADDGSKQYLIATSLLKKFSRTTVFSIQNTQTTSVEATIKLYDADNSGVLAATKAHSIPGSSSKYIDMGKTADTGLPSGTTVFNGSAIIEVPDGKAVVAAASEMYVNKNNAANFEGIPLSSAANTVYMATGLCGSFGIDTFYAVQNSSTTPGNNASLTVTYKDKDGNTVATDTGYTIGPGEKQSIKTCEPSDATNMAFFTGSATIVSTGAPIAVIGKAQCNSVCLPSTFDFFTAFLGEKEGSSKLAAPFIRWANDTNYSASSNKGGKQRAYIAIMNLESTQVIVDVKYYGKDGGSPIATHQVIIPGLSKGNSNARLAGALGQDGMVSGEFGYYTDGKFGGSVVIEANSANPTAKFIAIVRVTHPGAGEDYNAVAIQ